MPEGDAVLRTARLLDRGLSGLALTGTDIRVPRLATADLSGGTVVETVARGKHLLTRIDHRTGGWTLHTHLKMDGSWRLVRRGQRWPKPAFEARVVLRTESVEAVGFLLGTVELFPRSREGERLGHLGPDLLGPDWDRTEALRRLRHRPDRPLFEALRDQRNLAGIGTIYAAEAAFLAGVDPMRPVGEVPDLGRLVDRARELMRAEWSRSGRMWVYGRRACRRCGGTVLVRRIGPAGRLRPAYSCPACQR
ncbi:MAG: DNA-formamidopyrimidine glycosylase family protein [Nocardioides sp.]|uniref:DNA-formamidopyrimidine glycosylase family protein n=1 Tax=Nocardioides sp. TaxID=35761 RepID=UPI0039E5DB19